jgi:uncharacterized protein (DUF169 family)
MNQYQKQWEELWIALEPQREAAGVKFLFTREEYDATNAPPLKSSVSYCNMIRLAGLGHNFKATHCHSECPGGSRAIGFEHRNAFVLSGCSYKDGSGLYAMLSTARKIVNSMNFIEDPVYGVEIRPLKDFSRNPDVVIQVTNSYSAMRLIQGYSCHFALKTDFRLSGMQAFCSECTATPYLNDDINLSVLCSGTRYRCGWKDDELALGIAYSRLDAVIDGLLFTLPNTEPEEKKKQIEARAKERNRELSVQHGQAYFLRTLKTEW